MSAPFVWFDNVGPAREATTTFLTGLFSWSDNDIGPMTFLGLPDSEMPFAATCDPLEGVSGWVPYVEVQDLTATTAKARENGATVIAEALQGPAGVATFLRDPGGAVLAIWKRGEPA